MPEQSKATAQVSARAAASRRGLRRLGNRRLFSAPELLATTAIISALATIGAAHAQNAPAPGAPAQVRPVRSQFEEIFVTARKRKESVLNVPVVETAIGRRQLEQTKTQDIRDIATLAPGLVIGTNALSDGTQVSIRGVGTIAYDPGIDQSVSLNVDGLQLTQGLAFSSAFFDMAQVEVLKGPQSLFFGKSSTAGVISILTADPTNHLQVIARQGYEFEARERQTDLIVSGPLTDTLLARLSFRYDAQDGYFENLAAHQPAILGGQTPGSDRTSGDQGFIIRGTLLWKPITEFDARLKVNQSIDSVTEPTVAQPVECPGGTGDPLLGIPFLNPQDDCKLNRKEYVVDVSPAAFKGAPNHGVGFSDTTQSFGSLELNYRPRPDLTFTSTTGYYLVHNRSFENTAYTGLAAAPTAFINGFHRREDTEEVRVNSDFTGPLNFTAGAFFERGKFSNQVTILGNGAIGLPPVLQHAIQTVGITTNSGFGQLRYRVLPRIELAAGVRYTDESRKDTPFDLVSGTPVFIPLAVPSIHQSNASPEFTITYKPTDDLTLFGSLKRAYKSGSYNIVLGASPGENNSFGDEKVEGGEIGLKSRWLDRSLTFNLAAYDYRYTGLQVGTIIYGNGPFPATATLNAGSALVNGLESDVGYTPEIIPSLHLHASANWTHAQLKTINGVPCYGGQTIAQGCNQNFSPIVNNGLGGFVDQNASGLPLIRAPKWQTTFGFEKDFDLPHDLTLVVTSNTLFTSKYLTNLPLPYYQTAYFKTDVGITLQGPRDRWDVALIGKNLNDVVTSGNCFNTDYATGNLGGELTGTSRSGPIKRDGLGCYADPGREVWLELTFRPFN